MQSKRGASMRSFCLLLFVNPCQIFSCVRVTQRGGSSAKQKEELRTQMRAVPPTESVVLVAIGQYIGEGFNFPRLDTMMLTMPISWQGNVEQYAGRLHRDKEDDGLMRISSRDVALELLGK